MNSLSTLAELFIGLAGFSGIVVALSGTSVASDPLDRFRVLSLLFSTLGGALLAALPLILLESGATDETTWPLASGVFSAYSASIVAWSIRQRLGLAVETLAFLHPGMWIFGTGGSAAVSIALLGNALGWPVSSSNGPYLLGLLYLLVLGCALFVRLLIVRPSGTPAA